MNFNKYLFIILIFIKANQILLIKFKENNELLFSKAVVFITKSEYFQINKTYSYCNLALIFN